MKNQKTHNIFFAYDKTLDKVVSCAHTYEKRNIYAEILEKYLSEDDAKMYERSPYVYREDLKKYLAEIAPYIIYILQVNAPKGLNIHTADDVEVRLMTPDEYRDYNKEFDFFQSLKEYVEDGLDDDVNEEMTSKVLNDYSFRVSDYDSDDAVVCFQRTFDSVIEAHSKLEVTITHEVEGKWHLEIIDAEKLNTLCNADFKHVWQFKMLMAAYGPIL